MSRHSLSFSTFRELESTIAEMSRIIKGKSSNKIIDLIHAANLSEAELQRRMEASNNENRRLNEELRICQESNGIQMRELRLEHERIVATFKNNIDQLLKQVEELSEKQISHSQNVT